MSTVKELFDITKELVEFLEKPFPKEDREPYIEKVEELLEKRQNLISAYKGPALETEQEMANAIVEWNKQIQQRLSLYTNIVKVDINKLKQQKQTGLKYENPYDAQPDGFFIDKKN